MWLLLLLYQLYVFLFVVMLCYDQVTCLTTLFVGVLIEKFHRFDQLHCIWLAGWTGGQGSGRGGGRGVGMSDHPQCRWPASRPRSCYSGQPGRRSALFCSAIWSKIHHCGNDTQWSAQHNVQSICNAEWWQIDYESNFEKYAVVCAMSSVQIEVEKCRYPLYVTRGPHLLRYQSTACVQPNPPPLYSIAAGLYNIFAWSVLQWILVSKSTLISFDLSENSHKSSEKDSMSTR